jgi:hypothetical protein
MAACCAGLGVAAWWRMPTRAESALASGERAFFNDVDNVFRQALRGIDASTKLHNVQGFRELEKLSYDPSYDDPRYHDDDLRYHGRDSRHVTLSEEGVQLSLSIYSATVANARLTERRLRRDRQMHDPWYGRLNEIWIDGAACAARDVQEVAIDSDGAAIPTLFAKVTRPNGSEYFMMTAWSANGNWLIPFPCSETGTGEWLSESSADGKPIKLVRIDLEADYSSDSETVTQGSALDILTRIVNAVDSVMQQPLTPVH